MNYPLARILIIIGLFSGRVWGTEEERTVDPRIHSVEFGLMPLASTKEHMGVAVGIRKRMRDFGTPGLSVAVIEGGRLAWARGYGVADSTSHRPVTAETLFQSASISKPLTALPGGQITTIVTPYQAPPDQPALPRGSATVEPVPGGVIIVGCENGGPCASIPNL